MAARWPQDANLSPTWSHSGGLREAKNLHFPMVFLCFSISRFIALRSQKIAPDGPRWPQMAPQGPQVGPKLAPRWPQDGLKKVPRRLQVASSTNRNSSYLNLCYDNSRGSLQMPPRGPQDRPRSRPRSSKRPPRSPQEAPRGPQEAPKGPKRPPRSSPEAPKRPRLHRQNEHFMWEGLYFSLVLPRCGQYVAVRPRRGSRSAG